MEINEQEIFNHISAILSDSTELAPEADEEGCDPCDTAPDQAQDAYAPTDSSAMEANRSAVRNPNYITSETLSFGYGTKMFAMLALHSHSIDPLSERADFLRHISHLARLLPTSYLQFSQSAQLGASLQIAAEAAKICDHGIKSQGDVDATALAKEIFKATFKRIHETEGVLFLKKTLPSHVEERIVETHLSYIRLMRYPMAIEDTAIPSLSTPPLLYFTILHIDELLARFTELILRGEAMPLGAAALSDLLGELRAGYNMPDRAAAWALAGIENAMRLAADSIDRGDGTTALMHMDELIHDQTVGMRMHSSAIFKMWAGILRELGMDGRAQKYLSRAAIDRAIAIKQRLVRY